jgi:hypothetical protein
MKSRKNGERRGRKEREENCVSPLLFSTERPEVNACWGKRWDLYLKLHWIIYPFFRIMA